MAPSAAAAGDTPPLKSKKPEDTAFKQQRLPAWQPILTPKWVIITFTVIGLIFLPLGIVLKAQSDAIVEYSLQYDGAGTPAAQAACRIEDANSPPQAPCTVSFTVEKAMKAPVYLYYQLDNFYQNHRRYVKSRSDAQLMGDVLPESSLSDCDPLKTINDGGATKVLSPCGLIANSFFNDWFTLLPTSTPAGLTLDEEGIAWESDVDRRFAQPEGFAAQENPANDDCATVMVSSPTHPPTDLSISVHPNPPTHRIQPTHPPKQGQPGAEATLYLPPNSPPGTLPLPYCVAYPDPDTFFYLYQRYPTFPNLAVEVRSVCVYVCVKEEEEEEEEDRPSNPSIYPLILLPHPPTHPNRA